MKKLIAAALLSTTLLSVPAFAKSSQKFETNLSQPVNTPVSVEVIIGEDLAYRANNLPKKLSERGSIRNSAFSNNGHYGVRDLNRLADRLKDKAEYRLQKEGVSVADEAPTTLRLVITDARPNRPTFEQLSKDTGLSYQSFGLGGAAFEGELLSTDGTSMGYLSYAWYDNDIEFSRTGGTWSDANSAIDRFAKKAAKSLN